jgi:hypothetical protein
MDQQTFRREQLLASGLLRMPDQVSAAMPVVSEPRLAEGKPSAKLRDVARAEGAKAQQAGLRAPR